MSTTTNIIINRAAKTVTVNGNPNADDTTRNALLTATSECYANLIGSNDPTDPRFEAVDKSIAYIAGTIATASRRDIVTMIDNRPVNALLIMSYARSVIQHGNITIGNYTIPSTADNIPYNTITSDTAPADNTSEGVDESKNEPKGESKMTVIAHYEDYNNRRYGTPWVAIVNPATARPDFAVKVGGYARSVNRSNEGDLYVTAPVEGTVYMYGQKDYRNTNKSEKRYAKYINGKFVAVTDLITALADPTSTAGTTAADTTTTDTTSSSADTTSAEKQVETPATDTTVIDPDTRLTGEQIKTPRGRFYLANMTEEEARAAGYGLYHKSDDGKYAIMCNGEEAFAIIAEQPEIAPNIFDLAADNADTTATDSTDTTDTVATDTATTKNYHDVPTVYNLAAVKKVAKSADYIMCRVYGDDPRNVYISNGHWVVKIDATDYTTAIEPVTKTAARNYRYERKTKAVTDYSDVDIRNVLTKCAAEADRSATVSPLSFARSYSDKAAVSAVVSDNAKRVDLFDSSYLAMVPSASIRVNTSSVGELIADDVAGKPAVMILPVRPSPDTVRAAKAYYGIADNTTDAADTAALVSENNKIKAENDVLKIRLAALEKELAALKTENKTLKTTPRTDTKTPETKTTTKTVKTVITADAPKAPSTATPAPTSDATPAEKAQAIADKLTALGVDVKINGIKSARPVIWITGDVTAASKEMARYGARYSEKKAAYWVNIA